MKKLLLLAVPLLASIFVTTGCQGAPGSGDTYTSTTAENGFEILMQINLGGDNNPNWVTDSQASIASTAYVGNVPGVSVSAGVRYVQDPLGDKSTWSYSGASGAVIIDTTHVSPAVWQVIKEWGYGADGKTSTCQVTGQISLYPYAYGYNNLACDPASPSGPISVLGCWTPVEDGSETIYTDNCPGGEEGEIVTITGTANTVQSIGLGTQNECNLPATWSFPFPSGTFTFAGGPPALVISDSENNAVEVDASSYPPASSNVVFPSVDLGSFPPGRFAMFVADQVSPGLYRVVDTGLVTIVYTPVNHPHGTQTGSCQAGS